MQNFRVYAQLWGACILIIIAALQWSAYFISFIYMHSLCAHRKQQQQQQKQQQQQQQKQQQQRLAGLAVCLYFCFQSLFVSSSFVCFFFWVYLFIYLFICGLHNLFQGPPSSLFICFVSAAAVAAVAAVAAAAASSFSSFAVFFVSLSSFAAFLWGVQIASACVQSLSQKNCCCIE